MTTNTLHLTKDIEKISENDMLTIAYELNGIEPGAGTMKTTQVASNNTKNIDPVLVLNTFGLAVALVCALVLFLPSLTNTLKTIRTLATEKIVLLKGKS